MIDNHKSKAKRDIPDFEAQSPKMPSERTSIYAVLFVTICVGRK